MSRRYLASRIADLCGPITAFREYTFRDVLPAFGNISERADQVANDYFNRIGSQPAGEYQDIDMSDVAEDAQSHSYDWWAMMTSLRQTMLNLMAAGLFHLVEQQLGVLSRDRMFDAPVSDTKLSVIVRWYREYLGIDLSTMPSWGTIDEMRLVANTVKHGEGGSARDLKALNSDLFANPAYAEFYERQGIGAQERALESRASAPLSGDDFFVTEEILKGYATRTEAFFGEIAAEIASQINWTGTKVVVPSPTPASRRRSRP